jgi:hypothetical protein
MSVKGWFDYDVTVVGSDRTTGNAVSELRKVSFTIFDLIRSGYNPDEKANIAREGALELVKRAHPTWDCLTVQSCIEV